MWNYEICFYLPLVKSSLLTINIYLQFVASLFYIFKLSLEGSTFMASFKLFLCKFSFWPNYGNLSYYQEVEIQRQLNFFFLFLYFKYEFLPWKILFPFTFGGLIKYRFFNQICPFFKEYIRWRVVKKQIQLYGIFIRFDIFFLDYISGN